jgi:outer membrane immunogenic protein
VVRKILLSMIALPGFAGFAAAADLAPPPYVAPTYDWSGFYLGGFMGGGWSRNEASEPDLGIIGTLVNAPVIQTTTGSSFIGGIEGGDRYQFGKLVIGWEADMGWGDTGGTSNANFGPLVSPGLRFTRTLSDSIKGAGTATSSVGIAHGSWLIYGKAGAAWAHIDDTYNTRVSIPGRGCHSSPGPADTTGWVVRLVPTLSGQSGKTGRSRPNTTISISAIGRHW